MTEVYFEHNPFTVETHFKINGEKPAAQSEINDFANQRLQAWIEHFFPSLSQMCGGQNDFDVRFKGIKSDCLDVEAAVIQANEQGMRIRLEVEESRDGEQRLRDIQALMAEAKQHRLFAQEIKQNNDIQRDFEAAFNKDFDVYVVATMSSGKSTLINAMLGCDLLPAMNEATTATIAKITDNDQRQAGTFSVQRVNRDGAVLDRAELVLTNKEQADQAQKIMRAWNADDETACIAIDGKIAGVAERDNVRLVLSDTPGPNNSQTQDHEITTKRYLTDSTRNPLILYILNGEQLGINDDNKLLGEIAEIMQKGGKQSKERFIFVLNKVDKFDPERGENIDGVVARAKRYLENNGISNPRVYPVSAYLTGLWRKRALDPALLTRQERNNLTAMEDLFGEENSMDLVQYMPLTRMVKESLQTKQYSTVLYRSGLPAVEAMIDEYIMKYSLPYRVCRAYRALQSIIDKSSGEAELKQSLQANTEELEATKRAIQALEKKKSEAFSIDSHIKQLKEEEFAIPDEAAEAFNQQDQRIQKKIRQFDEKFTGTGSPKEAKRLLNELEQDIKDQYTTMVVDLEKTLGNAQDTVRQRLSDEYKKLIQQLFAESEELDLPILAGFQNQMMELETSIFSLAEDEVEQKSRRVAVGTREVSTSTWWQPWTWFSTKTVTDYETQEYEEVNLDEIWVNRKVEILEILNAIVNDAQEHAMSMGNKLIHAYTDVMGKKIDEHFHALKTDLEKNLNDQTHREATIKQAKADLAEIDDFKQKLEQILNL